MPVALITGASAGFGRALATTLAEQGWQLVIDARNAERLTEAANSLPAGALLRALAGDVADPAHRAELARTIARLPGLDLLVNNASTLGQTPAPPPGRRRAGPGEPGVSGEPVRSAGADPAAAARTDPGRRHGRQHLLRRRGGRLSGLGAVRLQQGRAGSVHPDAGRRAAGAALVQLRSGRHAHRDAPGRVPRRGHQRPAGTRLGGARLLRLLHASAGQRPLPGKPIRS